MHVLIADSHKDSTPSPIDGTVNMDITDAIDDFNREMASRTSVMSDVEFLEFAVMATATAMVMAMPPISDGDGDGDGDGDADGLRLLCLRLVMGMGMVMLMVFVYFASD